MTARKVSLIIVAAALAFALTGCGIADTIRDKIQYDNGMLGGGSGISGGGYMEAAVRFTPFKLGGYADRQIMGVEIYNNAIGDRAVTVRLYSAGTASAPGSLLREKTDSVRFGWRVIYFDTLYTISSGSDLWVAWETWTDSTLHPFGYDTSMTPSPDGHFWRSAGDGWAVSSTGNYMIRAVLY